MIWECTFSPKPQFVRLGWPCWNRPFDRRDVVHLLEVCKDSQAFILKNLLIVHNPVPDKIRGKNHWSRGDLLVANPCMDTFYITSYDLENESQRWSRLVEKYSSNQLESVLKHLGGISHLEVINSTPRYPNSYKFEAESPRGIFKLLTSLEEVHLIPLNYSSYHWSEVKSSESWTTAARDIGMEWDLVRRYHKTFLTLATAKTARTLPKILLYTLREEKVRTGDEFGEKLWKYQFKYSDWDKEVALAAAKKRFLATHTKA